MDHVAFEFDRWEIRQNPYPYYRRLRRQGPVIHFEEQQSWVVSRFADAAYVLRRPELFSSIDRASFESTLIGADPPAHTRIRKLLSGTFSAKGLATLEGHIRDQVERLVRDMSARTECEFMTAFAMPFPLRVMANILGMDFDDCEHLRLWTTDMALGEVPISPRDAADRRERQRVSDTFFEEFVQQCSQRPPIGILDPFLQSVADSTRITQAEACDLAKLLVIAGSETTTNLLGSAVLALLRNPGQLRILEEEPALIPSMIEEVLRYETPTQSVLRRTTSDTEVAGVRIPANANVEVILGSANRDEARFRDPDAFVIRRHPNDHIAFGGGPHFCLGSHLARLEARVAFEAILAGFRRLRPAQSLDEVRFAGSTRMRGPTSLAVAFDVGSAA